LVGDVILTPCSTEEDDNCDDDDDDDGCADSFVVTSVPDVFVDGTSGNSGNAVCPYALLIHMTFTQLIERIIQTQLVKLSTLQDHWSFLTASVFLSLANIITVIATYKICNATVAIPISFMASALPFVIKLGTLVIE
jgi:hypothetical protein